jgi:hypothetical protein
MVARAGVSKRRVSRVLTSASDVPSLDFMEGLFGDEFPEAFSNHPKRREKCILDLPAELLAIIAQNLSSLDIKRLRLSSRYLGANIDLLFDRVYISPNRANLNCLQQILGNAKYKLRVSELVWDDAQLEEYPNLEAFRTAIEVDEKSNQREIEDRLNDLSRDSPNENTEYGVFEHDDLFDDDGRLTELAKGILLQHDSQSARDMIARNATAMSIADSYKLYQQLYREEQEIMKAGLDAAALRHALEVCPNLVRVVLTSEVWRPWNLYPVYHTPFHRSLPSGFRKPTVWPWLGERPHYTRAQDAHRQAIMCGRIANANDALPVDFRGYSIVVSSLLSVPNPSISEFIMYTGHERTGVAHHLLAYRNIDYTNTLMMARVIHIRRLVFSINTHCIGVFDDSPAHYSPSSQLRTLLDAMPHLEHLDLSLNTMSRYKVYGGTRSTPFHTPFRISEVAYPSSLKRLKTFALRNAIAASFDLEALIQTLESAQHITLDNVQINTNYFKLFQSLWTFYDFDSNNTFGDEMETQEPKIKPIFTVIEAPERCFHKTRMVCEELCEWLYGDEQDAESIPFEDQLQDFIKDGVGWVLDDRDERFAVRASEYRDPEAQHDAVESEIGRQLGLANADMGDVGDIDGDVDVTGIPEQWADGD